MTPPHHSFAFRHAVVDFRHFIRFTLCRLHIFDSYIDYEDCRGESRVSAHFFWSVGNYTPKLT